MTMKQRLMAMMIVLHVTIIDDLATQRFVVFRFREVKFVRTTRLLLVPYQIKQT